MVRGITPFLWFQDDAQDVVQHYLSIFRNAMIIRSMQVNGGYKVVDFELEGSRFTAFSGPSNFAFTEAVSLMVYCDSQQEIDHFWERLSEGGEKSRCGWLKDKFGLSWQIVPANLSKLLSGGPEQSKAVMAEVMKMDKLIIADMERAYERTNA